MAKEAPFDAWDGEDLDVVDIVDSDAAEEAAMHLDPESDLDAPPAHWSELTGENEVVVLDEKGPVWYFSDEQPDGAVLPPSDDRQCDLNELLERQHYVFPSRR